MNSTEPVAPAGVTCAVSVTACPNRGEGGVMLVTVVVVETCADSTPANRKTMQTAKTILGITGYLSLIDSELNPG
jgi:hypothetical protein